ncbi:phage tail protein [Streptomyces sp. AC536]|uniref:phage tail protein n=1 Tax=Streptomyces buecherae TaxID=2763006 RepID=UPI00164DFBAC|nr:phage tail protein [Streptomyces buecherae]MBC3982245.1 phage tail protein [Streptomyces buecherae]QNJ43507.1 phage tail protein [Streptomyces buecherae]
MRAVIPGLPTPHPLADQLPAVYLDQDFLVRFLGALDEVLAPVLLTLDNLPAYLHPRTAPDDFVAWMASWVATRTDEERPVNQRRAVVASAVVRHRERGTRAGLAAAIRVETGVEPEITESGATTWADEHGGALPGSAPPWVRVRLRVADPERFDRARLERLVAAEVPAHVGYRLEILAAEATGEDPGGPA